MGKTSKSSTGPSKAALPYLQAGSTAASNAYNGNQANLSNIDNALQSNMGTVLGTTLNNAGLNAASTYDQGVLGQSADPTTNPLFMNMLNQTNATTSNAVNGSIGTRGLAGGSAQTQLLANELGKADNSALLSQYNTNLTNQQAAASNATSVAGAQNSGISALLQYLTGQATIPTSGADDYANTLANLWGKSTTTTSTPSGLSSLEGLGGTVASLAGAFSDRRLKTDIEKVGELADGLGIYDFRYAWAQERERGVMADEVAALRPWALGAPVGGYSTVHYARL